jgi:hypothetical protein
VGRIGNYFNKELFGKPTTLPWGLEIPYQYRVSGGIPAQDLHFTTFQPSFLYELIWDLALAAFLVWLGHHAKIKPWGLFALYVAGYSGYRIFEESIRVDSSEYFLGLRLNMFVAVSLTVIGLVWFVIAQRRPERPYTVLPPGAGHEVSPDAAAAVAPDADQSGLEAAGQETGPQETAPEGTTPQETAAAETAPEEEADPGEGPGSAGPGSAEIAAEDDAEANRPSSLPGS